jgi:hypothetical protein
VWVYEEGDAKSEANLYVHHDLVLPAFPLALAWLDCDPSGRRAAANMAAVGTFSPEIEVLAGRSHAAGLGLRLWRPAGPVCPFVRAPICRSAGPPHPSAI